LSPLASQGIAQTVNFVGEIGKEWSPVFGQAASVQMCSDLIEIGDGAR
jgi:hypothetical protein